MVENRKGVKIKIANISLAAYSAGFDDFMPDICIRILDTNKCPENPNFPNLEFGEVNYTGAVIYQFRFDDNCDETSPDSITDDDAAKLFDILEQGVLNNKNILVHYVMGKCRSGAIVRSAQMIAEYHDVTITLGKNNIMPNSLVVSKITRQLWGY